MDFSKACLLAVGILALSPITKAHAFTLWIEGNNDVAAGWQTKTLSVDMDPGCATSTSVGPALGAAMAAWNAVPTADLTISLGNTNHSLGGSVMPYLPPSPTQTYTGNPLVYCDTTFDTDLGLTPTNGATDIPGADIPPTLNCASGSTYCPITGGIILLNFDAGDKSNIDSIAAVEPNLINVIVAHELGHALGLGHSADENALMYFNASSKTQLKLNHDDANGLSYLYPRNETGGGDKAFGCGTLALVGASNGSGKGPKSGGGSGGGPTAPASLPSAEFALFLLACFAMTRFSKSSKTS